MEKPKKLDLKKELLSWVLVIAGGFLLAWFFTRVVICKAVVPTTSMESTIMKDDKIIGNRLAYLFSNPKRGDIIIFKFPDNPEEDYVKRIIGLPGETVKISGGHVYIDGVLLEESYLNEPMNEEPDMEFNVPENSYFMMGDNRNSSWDARYWTNTYVTKDMIRGKVWGRYSPSWGFIK